MTSMTQVACLEGPVLRNEFAGSWLLREFLSGPIGHFVRNESSMLPDDLTEGLILVHNFTVLKSVLRTGQILLALVGVLFVPNTLHMSERF